MTSRHAAVRRLPERPHRGRHEADRCGRHVNQPTNHVTPLYPPAIRRPSRQACANCSPRTPTRTSQPMARWPPPSPRRPPRLRRRERSVNLPDGATPLTHRLPRAGSTRRRAGADVGHHDIGAPLLLVRRTASGRRRSTTTLEFITPERTRAPLRDGADLDAAAEPGVAPLLAARRGGQGRNGAARHPPRVPPRLRRRHILLLRQPHPQRAPRPRGGEATGAARRTTCSRRPPARAPPS